MVADENDAASPSIDLEGEFPGPAEGLANGFVAIFGGEHQHEAATAGAEQFAAKRAGLARGPIPVIDILIADTEAQGTLEFPSFMEEPAELGQIAGAGQRPAHFSGKVAHLAQDRHLVGRALALLLGDAVRIALMPGIEN